MRGIDFPIHLLKERLQIRRRQNKTEGVIKIVPFLTTMNLVTISEK